MVMPEVPVLPALTCVTGPGKRAYRCVTSGPPAQARTGLVGRAADIATIDLLLADVPQRGGALVLSGDAGIGKSALLQWAREMAGSKGFSVLAATGVQSEANLPYAGLHQLLRPLIDAVGQLPAQLRDAVLALAAFGMRDSEVADRFLTALAALELLADAAHGRKLLVIIDDAQWLDTPTVEALGFIARRIDAEPIVMLIAVRAGHPTTLAGAISRRSIWLRWTQIPAPPCSTGPVPPSLPEPGAVSSPPQPVIPWPWSSCRSALTRREPMDGSLSSCH